MRKQKKTLTLINNDTNKNEVINILGFKSIWIINIQLDAELHFLIPGITFPNQVRLKQKLE